MLITNYKLYLESRVNPVKSDLAKFDGTLSHKIFISKSGETFNVWTSKDEDTSLRISKLYVGKYAIDLGGYSPSHNDVWLSKDEFVSIVKTNKDDIVPSDVLVDVATGLRRLAKTHKDLEDIVVFAKSKFVSVSNRDILVDKKNSGSITFSNGNIKFDL